MNRWTRIDARWAVLALLCGCHVSPRVTTGQIPGPPGNVVATAGVRSATVSWTAPVSNGDGPLTGYLVTPFVDGAPQPAISTTQTTTVIEGLADGTTYVFHVSATNAAGSGPPGISAAVTTASAPGMPTGVSASAGDREATIRWIAPASGGSPITGYTVTPFTGSNAGTPITVPGNMTQAAIIGLTNGTSYTFTVEATNAVGQGSPSAPSNAVTPTSSMTVPGAPLSVQATGGLRSATLSWAKPESDGGSPITGYVVTPYQGTTPEPSVAVSVNTTTTVVNGLLDGTTYTLQVSAVNALGIGPAATSPAVSTASAPGAPTAVTASAGNEEATIQWTAPADGGSPIISYTVTPYIGASAGTPISTAANVTQTTISGLTNGSSYTFTVTATNAVGTGPASAPSNAVTPSSSMTVPGAPTNVQATAGVESATLSWTAPASDGNSPTTGYVVTPFIGATAETPILAGSGTQFTIPGLTNGTTYTFTVAATNAVGTGPASVPSNAVTPSSTMSVPGAPTNVQAAGGIESATVSWTAPASDGNAPITGYVVTPYQDTTAGTPVAVGGDATTATVGGLANGATYTFQVSAVNAVGVGPEATSPAVTTATAPGQPAGVMASAGNGEAMIEWTAPASGGSPITGYVVTPYIGSSPGTPISVAGITTQVAVGGLINGTAYTFTVTATNAVGSGAPSAPSNTVTPSAAITAPGAPTNVIAVAGLQSVEVSWSAPASDGGSSITGYVITPYIGAAAQAPASVGSGATQATVSGLTADTAYTFDVVAVSGAGESPPASSNQVTPFGPPSASTSTLVASPTTALADGKTRVMLAVTVKDAGGVAISGAAVSLTVSGSWNILKPSSGATDSQGTLTAALTSTQGETKAVTATAGAFALHDSVVFTPVTCTGMLDFTGIPADISISNPLAVAEGDFNGDGNPDLALSFSPVNYQSGADTLAIFLGNGDATFQSPTFYPGGTPPSAIAVADFNHDGKADLALAGGITLPGDQFLSGVNILLGNGDGTFQPLVNYGVNEDPDALTVADFNGDGNLDIATANASNDPSSGGQDAVAVLLGDGQGRFVHLNYMTLNISQTSIASGDFNDDGKMDLAVVNEYDKTYVFNGNGDGTFASPVAYTTDGWPVAVTAADLNHDGIVDLVVGNRGSITSFLGAKSGPLQEIGTQSTASFGGLFQILSGDFNGDGNPDVAIAVIENSATDSSLKAGQIAPGAVVLPGTGNGSFGVGLGYSLGTTSPNEGEWESIASGDFDRDGTLDLAVSNLNSTAPGGVSNIVSELLGNGDGTLRRFSKVYMAGSKSDSIVGGDFNEDGIPDIAVTNGGSGSVSILLGKRDGTLGSGTNYGVGASPGSVVAGDVNDDGHLDLAVANMGGTTVSLLQGNGDGTFRATTNLNVMTQPAAIALGDLNGDHKEDLAVAASGAGQVGIWFGDGSGGFTSAGLYSAGSSPVALALADLDGNGSPDVAVADQGNAEVSILLNTGSGVLATAVTYPVGNSPGAITTGDFNGDGKLDLAVANSADGTVSALLGSGGGQFHGAVSYSVGSKPGAIAAADMNGDGKLDIVVADTGGVFVSVLYGKGDGTFQVAQDFAIGHGPSSLVVDDFDLDGFPDIAAVDTGDGNIGVLLSRCGM